MGGFWALTSKHYGVANNNLSAWEFSYWPVVGSVKYQAPHETQISTAYSLPASLNLVPTFDHGAFLFM
jgi:hypothetical protein